MTSIQCMHDGGGLSFRRPMADRSSLSSPEGRATSILWKGFVFAFLAFGAFLDASIALASEFDVIGPSRASPVGQEVIPASSPAVAINKATGAFVMSWIGTDPQNPQTLATWVQRYDKNGNAVGNRVRASPVDLSVDAGSNSSVSINDSGAFVVSWTAEPDGKVFSQRYDPQGNPSGQLIQTSLNGGSYGTRPSVAMATDGSFVVSWNDANTTATYFQRYDFTGIPVPVPIPTQASTIGHIVSQGSSPSVAMNKVTGAFVVSWQGNMGIFSQRYDAAGIAMGPPLQSTAPFAANPRSSPSVSMAGDGTFVVSWNASAGAAYFLLYNPAGSPVSSTTPASTLGSFVSPDSSPSVSINDMGAFVVGWNQQAEPAGIFVRHYDVVGNALGEPMRASLPEHVLDATTSPSVASADTSPFAFVASWNGVIYAAGLPPDAASFYSIYGLLSTNTATVTTPTGSAVNVGVTVIPIGSSAVSISLEFGNVTAAGQTTVTTSASAPPAPIDTLKFKLGDAPVYYDISTTATYSGGVKICFSWTEGQFSNESLIRILHYENADWYNVTGAVPDVTANRVCGQVYTLSPFVLVEVVPYPFTGFFQPVDNPPNLNSVKAGRAVPVKFSLGGNRGLDIFAPGYPASRTVQCSAFSAASAVEETVSAGGSTLYYDSTTTQYTYVWKTNSTWANTCRELVLRFNDGSEHVANFGFTK